MSDDIRESIRRFDAAVAERDQLRAELNEQDLTLTKIRHRAYQLEVDRDRLQELLAAAKADYDTLAAERDRLKYRVVELKSVGQSYKIQRDALTAQLARAIAADRLCPELEDGMTVTIDGDPYLITDVAFGMTVVDYVLPIPHVVLLCRPMDAYQATPATTEREGPGDE